MSHPREGAKVFDQGLFVFLRVNFKVRNSGIKNLNLPLATETIHGDQPWPLLLSPSFKLIKTPLS